MAQSINININFDRSELDILAAAVEMVRPPTPDVLPDFDTTVIEAPKSANVCGRDSPVAVETFINAVEIDTIDLDEMGAVFNVNDDEVKVVAVKKPDNPIDEDYLNKIRYGPTGIQDSIAIEKEVKAERAMHVADSRLWPELEFARYMSFYNKNDPLPGKKLSLFYKPLQNYRITRGTLATGSHARATLATATPAIINPTPIRPSPIIPKKRSSDINVKYAPIANKKPRIVENRFRCKIADIVKYVPELDRKMPAVTTPTNFEQSTIAKMYQAEKPQKKSYFKLANPGFDKVIQEPDIVLKEGPPMMRFKLMSKSDGTIYRWAPAVNRSNKVIHNDKGYILYVSENGFAGTWKPNEDGGDGVVTTRRMTIDTETGKKRFSFKQRQIQVDVLMKNCFHFNIFNKWVGK